KGQACAQHHDSLFKGPALDLLQRSRDRVFVVATFPGLVDLAFRFFDCDAFRCERHSEWPEIEPMFRSRQASFLHQAVIEWSRGVRCQKAEDGKSGRPRVDRIEGSVTDANRVAFHSEDKGCDRVYSAVGKFLKCRAVL